VQTSGTAVTPGGFAFRILGPTEVSMAGRPVELPAGRARAILALLLLHPGEAIPAEQMIDELWGEHRPATTATVVQGHVSKLRKVIEPERRRGQPPTVLRTAGSGYLLDVEPDAIDANRFKHMLDDARDHTPEARSSTLAAALALWRGPALADFTYEPFAQRAIAALEELRIAALEERIEADLALGRHAELTAEIGEMVAAYPFRERLRGALMLALYRSGRQSDALAAYRDARETLVAELGIEPNQALRSLEAAILAQDASLEPTVAPTPQPPWEDGAAWLPRERKVVTVVYADLAPVGDPDVDPEARRRAMARSLDVVAGVMRGHGARVEEIPGDLILGTFGLPVAHEDDAVRAVGAALAVRASLRGDAEQTGFRAGIATGEIVTGGRVTRATGAAITLAARLQQAAVDGEVLVGPVTKRSIEGAAVLEPVRGAASDRWRLLELIEGAPAIPRRLDAPLVGRGAELTRVRTSFASAARHRAPFRLTLLGEAGIGKSRLARAFTASIGDAARVCTGKCPAFGDGRTFVPLRQALLDAAGPRGWTAIAELLDEEEDGRRVGALVAGAIGIGPQTSAPDELFAAIRRLFEILAAQRPLAVVLEDVHWAQPTFLDLVDYLSDGIRGPVFMLCLARPELVESRPGWGTGSANADVVFLEPLGTRDIEHLIGERSGGCTSANAIAGIAKASRGNPLFAEQLLVTHREGEPGSIPSSLRSLLASRIDRLGPGERDLLRSAAIAGDDLTEEALLALVPDSARRYVESHLAELERRRLIVREPPHALAFGHALIRDAAYQSITRADRARLHVRFADWLDIVSEPPVELDAIVGFHLEHAFNHGRASGEDGEEQHRLGIRAGERLAEAGARAHGRFDLPAAENLLSRARALLPRDHVRRAVVDAHLAEACLPLGHHTRAQELLGEQIETTSDPSRAWDARVERARSLYMTGPDPATLGSLAAEAEEAEAFYAAQDDDTGRARSAILQGLVHLRAGRIVQAEAFALRAMALADRSGNLREQLTTRWLLAEALVLGPTPLEEVIGRLKGVVEVAGRSHPMVLHQLAIAHAMSGRFDEAKEVNEQARALLVERYRVRRLLMFTADASAQVSHLAGEQGHAEAHLRTVLAFARETHERDAVARAAGRLALLLHASGQPDDAATFAAMCAEQAPAEAVVAQALARAASARVASTAGRHDEAEERAREAVGLAPEEMLTLRADMLVELATVLTAAGGVASGQKDEAIVLFERKGNRAAAGLIQP